MAEPGEGCLRSPRLSHRQEGARGHRPAEVGSQGRGEQKPPAGAGSTPHQGASSQPEENLTLTGGPSIC